MISMKKTTFHLASAAVFAGFVFLAFASEPPPSKTNQNSQQQEPKQELGWIAGENNNSGWATIPINEKITFALAWEDITGLMTKQFEFEMMQKETGYIRTKWKNWHLSNGQTSQNYRIRVTIKIHELRKKVEVNTEAERLINGVWIKGTDTRVLEDLKKDIGGLVGA